ncbi:MAG: hypothetical protein H0T43_04095 [Solirubrobacterales bacterium]|nr:hypothetical protein [Solirubrobacterales bacterium]
MPQGFVARFLLRTDVLTTLLAGGARVVALVPNADEPYLREELGARDVHVEQLHADVAMTQRSRLWSLLYHLRTFTLGDAARARTLHDKHASFQTRIAGDQHPAVRLVLRLALKALWRSRTLRRAAVWLEARRFTVHPHRELFARYRPDLVVTASAGWFHEDAVLLREAQAHGVATACVVLSWDNPTSKGYRAATPDLTIAWSQTMADQLVRFQELPRDRVVVGGVPHFDAYRRPGALLGWEELCARLQLDRERRLILFCASSPGTAVDDVQVAATLAAAIGRDELGPRAQLVVRPHPIAFRGDRHAPVEDWRGLEREHEHVRLNLPDVRSDVLRCDMSGEDGLLLGSLVAHAGVVVNVFSTTTLEAFLAGTPVVLVDPAIGGGVHRPFAQFTHVRSIVDRGAARVAGSAALLLEHVRAYLEDPALDAQARDAVAALECGPADGHAGARVGELLLELAGTATPARARVATT